MGYYKITMVFESWWDDTGIDADSLEKALEIAKDRNEWEEDLSYRPCVKGYWAMIDEEGEAEDAGDLTAEQLQYLQR